MILEWYGRFLKWGYPQSSSTIRFSLTKKPSSWGTPMTMVATPLLGYKPTKRTGTSLTKLSSQFSQFPTDLAKMLFAAGNHSLIPGLAGNEAWIFHGFCLDQNLRIENMRKRTTKGTVESQTEFEFDTGNSPSWTHSCFDENESTIINMVVFYELSL